MRNFDVPRLSFAKNGLLAQLVERLNGIEEVSGSNPLGSTTLAPPSQSDGGFLAGGPLGVRERRNRLALWQIVACEVFQPLA